MQQMEMEDNKEDEKEGFLHKKPKTTCQCFSDFCGATSIHGVQYIGERKRGFIDRILWLLLVSSSIACAAYMISVTYDKWVTTPIIVSFHQKSTPIWKIPFPSVTICPSVKIKQSVFNISKFEKHEFDLNSTEIQKYEILNTMCSKEYEYISFNTTTAAVVFEFMKLTPTDHETIFSCSFGSVGSNCVEHFSQVLTEDGICYSFNMLDPDEFFTKDMNPRHGFIGRGYKSGGWNLDGGYPIELKLDTYPRRALGANSNAGLTIILMSNLTEQDDFCDPIEGYKIMLHNPATLPTISKGFTRIPFNQNIKISVTPDVITTGKKLRRYSHHKRFCYFSDEKRLKFFQTYTQSNCEMECLTNFTYEKCGCVAYYMPHELHTPICGSGRASCMETAEQEIYTSELEKEVLYEDEEIETGTCGCFPSCTSIVYHEDVTQAPVNKERLSRMFANELFPKDLALTEVNILMAESQFIATKRAELYGVTDFIANCGGLLGLFMGFSLLSLVEIFYHLLLGICNKMRNCQ